MANADESARAVVDRHWDFLLDLRERGRLVFAGRCYDGPFGIVVFEAEDLEAAQALMESDPSVRAGLQTAELHPFKVGLTRSEAA